VGGGNPPAQSITVQNAGGGALTFSISSSDLNLATVSPINSTLTAGQSTTVTVFVTNPNVAGTRTATLSISAAGALGSPQFVTITVLTEQPAPMLRVTPTSLTFNMVAGQGNPPAQSLDVRNSGGGVFSFNIISSDPLVSASPTGGTLSGGQGTAVQISAINPNVPGTRTTTLTVNAPQAQNSPQLVTVTLNVSPSADPNEPNDNPSQATRLTLPAPGQSISIMGNATANDSGFMVTQLVDECDFAEGIVHDWFRLVVSQRDSFQVALNFSGADIDYDLWWFRATNNLAAFPQGIQLFALSAREVGQSEFIQSRVLEPGTYYFGVTRFRRNDPSDLAQAGYTLVLTRGLSPETHAIEDAACIGFLGPETNVNGRFVVNQVRPTKYPARLESISAVFFAHPGQPSPNGRPVRIIAFADPTGSGTPPSNPTLLVDRTIMVTIPADNQGQLNTLTLGAAGPLIDAGDFYVGYVVDTANGIFPDGGRVLFPGMRSFASSNGGQTYAVFDLQSNTGQPLNVIIRAGVNTTPSMMNGTTDEIFDASGEEQRQKIPIDRPRVKLEELYQ
jgi:hypothetical protein